MGTCNDFPASQSIGRRILWVLGGSVLLACASVPLELPAPTGLPGERPAITTGLSDAVTEVPFLDDFNPPLLAPLTRLTRGPHNGFLLSGHGLFELNARSYCLNAGRYAPSGGDGYLYAPLLGPRASIIRRIVQRSVEHPDIPQHRIQSLIWAILAHARISGASVEIMSTATALLSAEDLKDLDSGALGMVSDELLQRSMARLPPLARQAMEAEARLRSMLAEGRATYEQLESTAVLFGRPPPEKGDREVPSGRWSFHPKGYFVRYFPSGYTETRIQLALPRHFVVQRDERSRISAIEDELGNRIEAEYEDRLEPQAVPGDTGTKATAFRAIRFVRSRAIGPEVVVTQHAEWENTGWTLFGVPSGKAAGRISSERFPGLEQRLQQAVAVRDELISLVKNAKKLRGVRGDDEPATTVSADAMDLAHFDLALQQAIGRSLKDSGSWTAEHIRLAKEAWMDAVRRSAGSARDSASLRMPVLLASSRIEGMVLASDEDPCDRPPEPPKDAEEHDPTDGTATPGNTGSQRLLTSGVPADPQGTDPDCAQAAAAKAELKTVRDAFEKTPPRPGEDGYEYAKRVQGGFTGAVAPMGTTLNCTIEVNEAFYQDKPGIVRAADCAHERVHQAKCRWARDHATGGYGGWVTDPKNYRQNELDAYKAGMDKLDEWMRAHGCN